MDQVGITFWGTVSRVSAARVLIVSSPDPQYGGSGNETRVLSESRLCRDMCHLIPRSACVWYVLQVLTVKPRSCTYLQSSG